MRAIAWWLIGALTLAAAQACGGGKKMTDKRTEESIALMMSFAERTGLSSGRPAKRYLWTDAFALCNLLGLARATGDKRYRELALRLVD